MGPAHGLWFTQSELSLFFASSEQAAFDPKPDERLEQAKRAEQLTRKPCH